jgi:thiol:disulfide interchange protein DsbD
VLSALAFLALLHAAPAPSATATGAVFEGRPRVRATLIAEVTQVEPGGTFRLGVELQMAPGWHVYWKNPGEAGLASEVVWDAPRLLLGPQGWPAPTRFVTPDGTIVSYGYAHSVLFPVQARLTAGADGPFTAVATADVLVCDVQCIPAKMELTRLFGVGPRLADTHGASLLEATLARIPRRPEEAGARALARRTTTFVPGQPFEGEVVVERLDGTPEPLARESTFVPERTEGVTGLQGTAAGPGQLRLWGKALPDAKGPPARLRGVVALAHGGALELDVPLAPAPDHAGPAASAPDAAPTPAPSLLWVLLLAFAGGVLLNAMPCVFPVLALKAYGFVRTAHADRGALRTHALAYALGVVGSLLVLATGVLGLRAAGHGVGWGFQFQEPLFVAVLAAVVVLFALWLLGVVELLPATPGAGALSSAVDRRHGPLRSAGEGVLAVVLATPCSAPLLGTAVGFAFAASAGVVLAVFATVGLGLAAPFCALVLLPGLARRLPRPGPWMERAKQLLGFALLATGVWLISVLGNLAGVTGVVRLLSFLLVLSFAAWAWASWPWRVLRGGVVVGVLVAAGFCFRFAEPVPARAAADAWSEEAVTRALASGKPVFVDFTADWCLSCKFNERTVLGTARVREALTRTSTRVLVADWTRRDAAIGRTLAAHGRAGVPMYLVYSPSRPDAPEVLPELLTAEAVVSALERAAASGGSLGLSTPAPATR